MSNMCEREKVNKSKTLKFPRGVHGQSVRIPGFEAILSYFALAA